MAQIPFPFNGQTYTVDDQGTIYGSNGQPVPPQDQANIALQQAAAQATSGAGTTATTPVTPTDATPAPGALPATPPRLNAYGTAGEPAYTESNPPPRAAPAAQPAPATPATPAAPAAAPPRTGAGSATELRTQRDAVQKQIDDINKAAAQTDSSGQPIGLTNAQSTLLASLEGRVAQLTADISKTETPKDKPPSVLRTTGSPNDPYNIIDNGDGTITPVRNPNYTGQVQPQVVSHGNHTFVITPPTPDELKADPNAAPHTTVAYTDTDAQELAQKQNAVAEKNADTAAKAQAATAAAEAARTEIAERVSRGEDAASVRADVQQKLEQAHQAWVEADGDRKAAQQALDSYNAERHALAAEKLSQEQIDNTAAQQARQDATQRYGYETSAASSKYAADTAATTSRYATDVSAHNAKLQAAASLIQAGMSQIAEINKALPPGSDLAGKALPGLMAYIEKFVNDMSGPAPAAPGAPIPAPAGTPQTPTNPTKLPDVSAGVALPDVGAGVTPPINPEQPAPDQSEPIQSGILGGTASALGQSLGDAVTAATQPAPDSNAPPAPPTINLGAIDTTGAALAAQNAASHQRNMAGLPGGLAPDGSPFARPEDVARAFGKLI
jgi:hypothetical protein